MKRMTADQLEDVAYHTPGAWIEQASFESIRYLWVDATVVAFAVIPPAVDGNAA